MIVHVTTASNNRTMTEFMAGPAQAATLAMGSMTYGELSRARLDDLPRAAWIFSDIDLLEHRQAFSAARRWRELADRGDRLLNHPTRSMGRFELLRTLHDAGINDFDVFRATDPRRPGRYPVFVRWIHAHSGPISTLLRDRRELDRYLARCLAEGLPRDVLMAVEHCDTREANGLVRQYGAFCVGRTIIPEHLWFSREWAIKAQAGWEVGDAIDREPLYAEEQRFVAENPHEAALRRIFELARIEYGRVDYGLRDGRIQVWDINSNPCVTIFCRAPPGRDSAGLLDRFMGRFIPALSDLSEPASAG